MKYRELLLGCGRARDKRLVVSSSPSGRDWSNLTTCDFNPAVKPDIVCDLGAPPWPIESDRFDEVHAYEVLEHLGRQGDFVSFFGTFYEIWRVLKPGGFLVGTCPSRYSPWLWGDPGHTRAILKESLIFLGRPLYKQCDQNPPTMMSDYRQVWRGDLELLRSEDDKVLHRFVLKAHKPGRPDHD